MQRYSPLLYAGLLLTVGVVLFVPLHKPPAFIDEDREPGHGGIGGFVARAERQAPKIVQVPVWRHPRVPLRDDEARAILASMSRVLSQSDGAGDVVTPVTFQLKGRVQVLPAGIPAVVQSQRDYERVLKSQTGVKVVSQINWCGGHGSRIIGCADLGVQRVNLAVVRFQTDLEHLLWLHEYGHNCGNPHRSNDRRALMAPSISPQGVFVNATEAQRYRGGPASAIAAFQAGPCPQCEQLTFPADVGEFVRQHWIEGIPRAAAAHYGPRDAQRLLGMLKEPERHQEHLPAIVQLLCWIGDESALPALQDIVYRPRSDPAAVAAQHAVAIHLGEFVARTHSAAAKDFLEALAGDGFTAQAAVAPVASAVPLAALDHDVEIPSAEQLASELSDSAKTGLAIAAGKNRE